MTHLVTGSPATCAERMAHFSAIATARWTELMLIFADYREGLAVAGREILPRLRSATP